MAIDSIENNELGALSQSRLGSKCFVDDDRYVYLSKAEKNRRTARSKAEVDATWRIDPVYENNCEYLTTRLRELQDSIENEMSKNPSKTTKERLVFPMKDYETRYKQLITRNKCVEIIEKQEAEASKKETLDILTQATATPPSLLEQNKSDKTTKYIIYGVGGVIVLISLVLLMRKSK
jgi:hypothetical protein